ncbi:hypothetical protein HNQ50_001491 [Silvimonas terrae]|uniref:Uncharacterized protein n=1 Tax=Silvimonas terrae TaxID=300266 RepID=A0A840RBF9_9NEIS|nr:hypothetical protein [Silvimonas terrae]MBB5190769.1 hypothetical protein [Silvimonas terrae]
MLLVFQLQRLVDCKPLVRSDVARMKRSENPGWRSRQAKFYGADDGRSGSWGGNLANDATPDSRLRLHPGYELVCALKGLRVFQFQRLVDCKSLVRSEVARMKRSENPGWRSRQAKFYGADDGKSGWWSGDLANDATPDSRLRLHPGYELVCALKGLRVFQFRRLVDCKSLVRSDVARMKRSENPGWRSRQAPFYGADDGKWGWWRGDLANDATPDSRLWLHPGYAPSGSRIVNY